MPGRHAGKTLLATKRLALREFRPDDAENLYRLNRDPRVMRYISNGSVDTRASVSAAIYQVKVAHLLTTT
ncbi:MAG TPA: GNAT family N-acetyltransferase [Casimicrobiaceae bacterium]